MALPQAFVIAFQAMEFVMWGKCLSAAYQIDGRCEFLQIFSAFYGFL
jgi:hypothetical protein